MVTITNETVSHAIDYISQHIGEELSVEDVAAHCHFSKYHFSRMFKEQTGESVYAFIKRLKLEQSAFRLKVERGRSVTDIGYAFGYSPSNYSWLFRQQYQTNPVNFRRNCYETTIRHPFFHNTASQMESFAECDKKITVQTLPDYRVLYDRRIGSYRYLSGQWHDFMEKYREYITDDTLFLNGRLTTPRLRTRTAVCTIFA